MPDTLATLAVLAVLLALISVAAFAIAVGRLVWHYRSGRIPVIDSAVIDRLEETSERNFEVTALVRYRVPGRLELGTLQVEGLRAILSVNRNDVLLGGQNCDVIEAAFRKSKLRIDPAGAPFYAFMKMIEDEVLALIVTREGLKPSITVLGVGPQPHGDGSFTAHFRFLIKHDGRKEEIGFTVEMVESEEEGNEGILLLPAYSRAAVINGLAHFQEPLKTLFALIGPGDYFWQDIFYRMEAGVELYRQKGVYI